jgi:hypothetical protein
MISNERNKFLYLVDCEDMKTNTLAKKKQRYTCGQRVLNLRKQFKNWIWFGTTPASHLFLKNRKLKSLEITTTLHLEGKGGGRIRNQKV